MIGKAFEVLLFVAVCVAGAWGAAWVIHKGGGRKACCPPEFGEKMEKSR